jgi:ribosomal protein S18 acetylase RimI-like enzyme
LSNTGIRVVERADTQAALGCLTLAFAADPIFRYFWERPADYLQYAPPMMMAMGERGFEHASVFATDDFDAVAMWLPPGVEPNADALRAIPRAPTTPERERLSAELRGEMQRHHPTTPHWYLWAIGVDPRRQGQGLGSALLKHALQTCDARGDAAYLESSSPKNVPLYERHGFEVMSVIRVGDIPPITPMLRPARR